MFAALAVIVAFGVRGQAQAQAVAGQNQHAKLTMASPIQPTEDMTPDLEAQLFGVVNHPPLVGGSLAMGVIPPLDGSGDDEWPCFGGGADCSAIASGGYVSGYPNVGWSKSGCNNKACAQLIWWVLLNSSDTTDDVIITIEVKQGTKVINYSGPIDFGPQAAGTYYLTDDYLGFGTKECASGETCGKASTGLATMTATIQVGSSSAHSTLTFLLQ